MKKYTIKELKEAWVEYVEQHPIEENNNRILNYICWLDNEYQILPSPEHSDTES